MSNKSKKIKFLVDECVGLPTIILLRKLGYSVITVGETNLRGKTDLEILKWAIKEKRILITEDIDFANILLYPPKTHCGIIVLRFRHKEEEKIHITLTHLLKELKPDEFKGSLIIVDEDKYRIRKE